MRKLLLTSALFLAMTSSADAQETQACHNAQEIAKHLEKGYGETPVAFGILQSGNLLQVFASDDTWTIVVVRPDGVGCIMAAGRNWQQLQPKPEGPMA